MSAKKYFAYIRVSTVRQGQSGTSLSEQRSAINAYAQKWNLHIVREFEEQETAAKLGRPVFRAMLKGLKRNHADGVIMHKIDRSARNLRDWAELGELIDKGIDVQFANDNLDLYTRGGRLSADIQAVVAADYIRNLREEVIKGFYGRLKQGYYPMPAPIGYLDCGAGQPKTLDPNSASLIRKTFECYANGDIGLRALAGKMRRLGLRGKQGQIISAKGLGHILRNPFYTGIILLKKSGEIYPGKHLPIVSRKLYDLAQEVLEGRLFPRSNKSQLDGVFLFRKLLTCENCEYRLIGEKQKGHLYYRCHTQTCPQKTVREEVIEYSVKLLLRSLQFNSDEVSGFREWHKHKHKTATKDIETERKTVKLELNLIQTRLSRLTDALVNGTVDEALFVEKKNELVIAQEKNKERMSQIGRSEPEALKKTEEFLELANSAYLSYERANFQNKRDLIKTVASNFLINGKSIVIKTNLPFELIVNRTNVTGGGPYRNSPRTFPALLSQVFEYFCESGESHAIESKVDLGLSR